jgi:excisionase family DNA binding protein
MSTLTPAELAERLFVTPNEAAAVLQWDARTVRKLISDGTIPATRSGASYRIPARWVTEQAAIDGRPGQLEVIEARVTELETTIARLGEVFGGVA